MLKGQAKKDYQREYMRKLRLKGKMLDLTVRPIEADRYEANDIGIKTLEILDKAMAETTRIDRGSFAQYVDEWAMNIDLSASKIPQLDADGNPVYEE